jgi:2-oxo-4-hydroxy-4-carboxy--5-ureidoimidazoline (OHCU) decarboxylase
MNTIPTPGEHAIQAALEQLSRDDMQSLIQRMVHQHPDLAGLIVSKQPTASASVVR